ncbi:hypothetical protein K443DRAFT_642254 [Laccaria amethystina LaAM-08-1]|uniref:Rds1 protein n=1 Tax=Laccaria amethystina LaAM-08-1 TaxID=1095629 RepID=A0A0C9WJ76_9AGAR|nr:hypothetical protein K443DRAFT_642254 [Laccaria amethystina LaAM-08-1]
MWIPILAAALAGLAVAWPTTTTTTPTTTALNFQPSGGLGTNSTPPFYHPLSDFDFQSLNLALNQQLLELDLFHFGLAKFTVQDFQDVQIFEADRFLIQFLADQKVSHATLLSNMIGEQAANQCTYQFPFQAVREFINFSQQIAAIGESGILGFIEHLNSRAAAQLLAQTLTASSREQMIFRQYEGLFPVPVDFQTAITQSMMWTMLAPFIISCPAGNPVIEFQNFPGLNVVNNPDPTPFINTSTPDNNTDPAITHNRSIPLSFPGRQVNLTWELPGQAIGPNSSFVTNTTAGAPQFVAWISQLNTTYTVLDNIVNQTGTTIQPNGTVFGNGSSAVVNATMFIAITDEDIFVTPFNISMINAHIVAGPAVYQAG